MPPANRSSSLEASVGRLTINSDEEDAVKPVKKPAVQKPKPAKKERQEVVDSWEDDVVSSDDGGSGDDKNDGKTSALPSQTKTQPASTAAPSSQLSILSYPSSSSSTPLSADWDHPVATDRSSSNPPSRRPEKTDAVARRLIAGALGIRAPKMTDERRAYEKAVREAERKRRDESRAAEKQRQEETERQKKAIWDD
ncbi:hypothetical protein SEPCBS119000_002187 [Sporothrix epigloea]|uniref:Ubiquitin-like protein smt3 n=1 Tax=Sporothrix epigloea TaxID=1892477 RepID=A0ABP0DES6_9PEZI